MNLSDVVVAFAERYQLRPEDLAAVLGISYSAARNLLRGSPPTARIALQRIETGLARNEGATSRDGLRLAEVPWAMS